MPETHPQDQHNDTATEALGRFSAALPSTYREHLNAISGNLSRARTAADTQASRMRQMYEDPTFERPVNHLEVSREAQQSAVGVADEALRAADDGITVLEAELRRAALPPAPSSSSDRIAARQEIDVVLGDAREMQALGAFETLTASTNPHVLGELASEYGRNLMQSRGVAPEGIARVMDYIIGAVAAGRTRDRARAQAAKALAELDYLKVAYTAASAGARGKLRRLAEKHRL